MPLNPIPTTVNFEEPRDDWVDPLDYWLCTDDGWENISPEQQAEVIAWAGLTEARLQEHPGHGPQSVHAGNRGLHNDVHADLSSPVVPGSLSSMQGGMHPCWSGRLENGTRVFIKRPYLNEHRSELGAEALNAFGGGLMRAPHTVSTKVTLPEREVNPGVNRDATVIVSEWIVGRQYHEGRHNPRLIQEEVDDINVFDFVTANMDRHMGNAMVTATGHVWAIDHGQSFGDVVSETRLSRTVKMGPAPFTPKQRAWLTKVAETDQDTLTEVINPRPIPGTIPFHVGYGRQVQQRAQVLLEYGYVPTDNDLGIYQASGFLPDEPLFVEASSPQFIHGRRGRMPRKPRRLVREARLREHPGHGDQKAHGRRGASAGLAAMRPGRWQDVGRVTSFGRELSPKEALEAFEMTGYTGEDRGPAIEAKIEAAEGLANELLADEDRLKAMCSDPPPKKHLDPDDYSGWYDSSSPVEDFMLQGSNFGAQHALPGNVINGPGAGPLLRARREESIRLQSVASYWVKMTPDQREQLLRTDESFRYALAAGYIKGWQVTAADHGVSALAVQKAAAKAFGLAGPPSAQNINPDNPPSVRRALRKADETFEDHGQFLTGMVRATYARTQYQLASRGITHVTVARGINSEGFQQAVYKAGPVQARQTIPFPQGASQYGSPGALVGIPGIRVTGHPLQSWSLDRGTALNFGMQTMVVKVSAKRIFSWPRTGQGCLSEQELVMLGGNDDTVWGGNWEED